MHENAYMALPGVNNFTHWLSQRISGQPIAFPNYGGGAAYPTLSDAFAAYSWPVGNPLATPHGPHGMRPPHYGPYPHPHSYGANQNALATIQAQLRARFNATLPGQNDAQLSGAVAAVLHWGGVYTPRGNQRWLGSEHRNLTLRETLGAVRADYIGRNDDDSAVAGLRFNSGLTKVYSLLLDDFIIYDSRVAASLAWLIRSWSGHAPVPNHLAFGTLPARVPTAYRNPDPAVFWPIRGPNAAKQHWKWNMRANWLLKHALRGAAAPFAGSLREVEASLFQMGYRVH